MQKALGVLWLAVIAALSQASCGHVNKLSETVTGQGTGEITDLGNRQFDIVASGGFSANRGDTYAKWERTAKLACKGGEYKTIKRDWQAAQYPGLLGGIIECAKKKP